jgi:hypothetical protein
MIDIIGVDIGLKETTISFMQSENGRLPLKWIEAEQWKKAEPIKTKAEANKRIEQIAEWFVTKMVLRGLLGHIPDWFNGYIQEWPDKCVVGVETYDYQGEARARNKWGPSVARLAGVTEGIARCLSDACYGISRNDAIDQTPFIQGNSADKWIANMLQMPQTTDQHTRAAALVGYTAFVYFRNPVARALSSASGSLGTGRGRTSAGRSPSRLASQASARAKRRTRSK